MSPILSEIPYDIASQTTPILVGSLLNYALYGALSVQVYIYHVCFPKDRLGIKSLVYSIYILETVQVCLNASDIYRWFGSGFGDVNKLSKVLISPFYTHLLGSMIAYMVQLFLCYRIWILKRSYLWFCIVIVCISTAQAGGGIGATVKGFDMKDFTKAQESKTEVFIWLIGGTVADVLIAAAMTVLLMQTRNRMISKRSDDIITRIMMLTLETNALTASVATATLIIYAVPKFYIYTSPVMMISKVYSNSLLITFNNRLLMHGSNYEQYTSVAAAGALQSPPIETLNKLEFAPHVTVDLNHLETDSIAVSSSTVTV